MRALVVVSLLALSLAACEKKEVTPVVVTPTPVAAPAPVITPAPSTTTIVTPAASAPAASDASQSK